MTFVATGEFFKFQPALEFPIPVLGNRLPNNILDQDIRISPFVQVIVCAVGRLSVSVRCYRGRLCVLPEDNLDQLCPTLEQIPESPPSPGTDSSDMSSGWKLRYWSKEQRVSSGWVITSWGLWILLITYTKFKVAG